MDLETLLERTRAALSRLVRRETAATLFLKADRYRAEGRYDEAAEFVAHGLAEVPDSHLGLLLKAYLHAARRQNELARAAFVHLLSHDPFHPRALLGLARLGIEEGDLDGGKALLDRALAFYADFPEAQALRDMLEAWATEPDAVDAAAVTETLRADLLDPDSHMGDLLISRADGSVVSAQSDPQHAQALARHMSRLARMATATLERAGLGPLDRGVIQTAAMTVVIADQDSLLVSGTLAADVDAVAALTEVHGWRARLGAPAGTP